MKFLLTLAVFLTLLSISYWVGLMVYPQIWWIAYIWGLSIIMLTFALILVSYILMDIFIYLWTWIEEHM